MKSFLRLYFDDDNDDDGNNNTDDDHDHRSMICGCPHIMYTGGGKKYSNVFFTHSSFSLLFSFFGPFFSFQTF